MPLSVVAVGFALLFGGSSAPSPQLTNIERESLNGLKALNIVVENGDDDWTKCNVRGSELELSAARPLVDAGIKVTDNLLDPYIYVFVTVLTTGPVSCIANYSVSARVLASASLPYLDASRTSPRVHILLWEQEGLMTGAAIDFGTRLNSAVRQLVDQFATKLKIANAK